MFFTYVEKTNYNSALILLTWSNFKIEGHMMEFYLFPISKCKGTFVW